MSSTHNVPFHGTLHSSGRPYRMLTSQLGALLLLLLAALITAGCGASARAAGSGTSQSLTLSGALPNGIANQHYNAVLSVSGGSAPYHFAVKSGSLPRGLTLHPVAGSISGIPASPGTYEFEVGVKDAPGLEEAVTSFVVRVHGGAASTLKISVSPTSATLVSNQKQQFTAAVSGTSNTGVKWSATAGSVDATGLYTAPAVNAQTSVVVTATSKADSSKSASAAATVGPVKNQPLQITTGHLPQGQQGEPFSETFTATGGSTPYRWSISAGAPPSGIAINAHGDFTGMPTALGTFSFTVTVADAANKTATGNFSVTVIGGDNFDGPAELPRVTVSSAMSDTPAPGRTIPVAAGGNLQAELNSANCGDTIALQAGATFTGNFDFPAKSCDNAHWIIVRTSAPDSSLPNEGQRLTPCYAGVASLPGRPQYPCNHPQNVLAKLVSPANGGPVAFESGANHYRLLGLELTRPTGTRGAPVLISLAPGGTANHIVVDRSWLHGTTQDETQDGFHLVGMNYVAIIGSYFSDFHCTSVVGSCTDAHAVGGGIGDHQDGPFLIENNFLEASGEAIMFGGGPAIVSPSDITIRSNHFFMPLQWRRGHPNFQGGASGYPFIVKNHLELKNAVRVLVEANLMENVWGGFSQDGRAILLGPKNQYSRKADKNVCPLCQVTDVTIRYTRISHAGGGIGLATSLSDGGGAALAGTRWSIHDVVMEDISRQYAGGGGLFMVYNRWPENPLHTITINHVTGFPDPNSHILTLGNFNYLPQMYGFVFTNNLLVTGLHPVWGAGGGAETCAYQGMPVFKIANCFKTYTFANNVLIGTPSAFPPSSWPAGNMFPPDPNAVFVQYNNGNGGDYQLQSDSPYKKKAADGRDPGADIVGLNAALAGVE